MTNPRKAKGKGIRGSRHAPPTNAFPIGGPGGPGRPKDDPELIEAFRARTPQALATLDKVMSDYAANTLTAKGDPLVPPAAAVRAAEVTLNRGWGAAPQTINLDAKLAAEVLHGLKPASRADQIKTLAVLVHSGALKLEAETTELVESKEPT